ncbi:hypothetical protein [Cupriavidus sp. TMH.W2]|uniref:hypothetical protein n=1 Tax=Cupriavidus sp. TMH.W2 TaxID=3434465 RepID=UPI003D77D44B
MEIKSNQSEVPLAEVLAAACPEGIRFGMAQNGGREPLLVHNEDLLRHVLVIDPNETGKNALLDCALAQQVTRGGGVIVIDSGRDNRTIDSLARFSRTFGRESDLLVINPFNPGVSNTYNLILSGAPEVVASQAMTTIPKGDSNPGADDYGKHAHHGLTVLVAAIRRVGLAYSLLDLAMFILKPNAMMELLLSLEDSFPDSPEASDLSELLDRYRGSDGDISHARLKENFGGIAGRLYMLGTGKLGQILNTYSPEVDLYTAIRENRLVYIAAPGTADHLVAAAVRQMICIDLQEALTKSLAVEKDSRSEDVPFMLVFGDANVSDFPGLGGILSRARSARVSTWLCARSLNEMEAVGSDLREWAIGGTWNKAIFDPAGSGIAAFFPEYAGDLAGCSQAEQDSAQLAIRPAELETIHPQEFVLLQGASSIRRGVAIAIERSVDPAEKFTRSSVIRTYNKQPDGADIFTRTSVV